MKFSSILPALTAIAAVAAETFTVQVGANGGLAYNPPSINASVGDTVAFQFLAKNHVCLITRASIVALFLIDRFKVSHAIHLR